MSQMIEVKTAELSGAALRWAVAQAEGLEVTIYPPEYGNGHRIAVKGRSETYRPDTNWSQGGPLFSKHLIEFVVEHEDVICAVLCDDYGMQVSEFRCGETHLIAACRAIVAAKLGDTVAVPAELLP